MDADEPANFGDLLRRYRLAAGLTQERLAERAGVSARGIAALETGERRTPRKETLRLLADALALSTQDRAALDRTARAQRLLPAQPSIQPQQATPVLGRERELATAPAASSESSSVSSDEPTPAGDGLHALRIQLLGGFQVTLGAHVIPDDAWRRRKAQVLVKLLALAPRHRLHREQILELLWPDVGLEAAANSLHQTLYYARKILSQAAQQPLSLLQFQNDILILGPHETLWVDAATFEAAAAHARERQDPSAYYAALDLYRGDLLPDDRYDDWAIGPRERLRRERLQLLLELARQHEAQREYAQAIALLQQVLSSDPAHEETHVCLMRLYALQGQRQQVLRQYQALRAALERELDVEPDQRSHQLYQEVLGGRFPPPMPPEDQPTHVGSKLAAGAPTLAALADTPPSNLPIPITRFIGREREIAEVIRFLATTRLLTLIGPGGVGKTRLALEVAANLLPSYPDGVGLVELAPLADSALVPQVIAAALSVRESAGTPLIETLVAALKPRQLLLVLDNCEHLVAGCAYLAETLLRACPHLRVLATSREPLHIPGEVIWLVPSLALLDPRQSPALDDLLRCEAVELFVDRAQAVLPSFDLTVENAHTIAQICARLDGMPLAIELAAACAPMLSVEQLAARLTDRFRLLTRGSRTALQRQQTLRATLDWSYDLLAAREQALFQRLAVFAGSFTLDAAEAICVEDGLDPSEILQLLTRLVDTSLVVVRAEQPGRRYRLLETIRQYSFEQLQATHELAALRERHLRWYLELARQAAAELHGPQQAHRIQQLELERDNLRAALEWGLAQSAGDAGLRLASAMYWFWYLGSYLSEGRAWFERALARTEPTDRTWARAAALAGTGAMALYQGDFATARDYLAESIPLWRELEHRRGLAQALFGLGLVAVNQGDHHVAGAALEESSAIFQALGQMWPYAMTLMHLGDVALAQGDLTTARARYEACLAVQRTIGDSWGIAQLLNNLGETARFAGDYTEAAGYYEQSLALFRELGTAGDVARAIHNLGYVARAQGDAARAQALFEESLKLFQERGTRRGVAECLAGLAGLFGQHGQHLSEARRAARLLGAVAMQFDAIGAMMWPADRREHARTAETLRTFLGQEAFAAALAEGRALTLEQAIAEALAHHV